MISRVVIADMNVISCIDGLDPTTDQDAEEAWMREIDRRKTEIDAGTVETIPWETVRARLRRTRRG